ncbi:MAG: dimethylsulfoniopropionate demethylase [Acidiferrobacterales bacterium]|nr:dimethylsulfoniopropionate demethylase [Acidiferrobacterales bacterium]
MAEGLRFSRRLRRTPYTASVEAAGVTAFSVVNHMLLPTSYGRTIEEDYWHLREHVQIWDVACQRQVQITGRDAEKLVQWMTPRDISHAKTGDCLYLPITDETGGMINDPILLKLSDDRFWLSVADSDLLLFAKGLALGRKFDVTVSEPDVSPLAVQGPKAESLVCDLFGDHIRDIGFFRFGWVDFSGTQQLIARTGYSRQGGFEIFLNDSRLGSALWDAVWQAGQPYAIAPGYPNLIDRIEGGFLSYGNEMTREHNPFEFGMGRLCNLNGTVDCLSRDALQMLCEHDIERQIRGILFDGGPCPTCTEPWPVHAGTRQIGQITSAVWSPRLERNVGLSLIEREFWSTGQKVIVHSTDGVARKGEVSALPFA